MANTKHKQRSFMFVVPGGKPKATLKPTKSSLQIKQYNDIRKRAVDSLRPSSNPNRNR